MKLFPAAGLSLILVGAKPPSLGVVSSKNVMLLRAARFPPSNPTGWTSALT